MWRWESPISPSTQFGCASIQTFSMLIKVAEVGGNSFHSSWKYYVLIHKVSLEVKQAQSIWPGTTYSAEQTTHYCGPWFLFCLIFPLCHKKNAGEYAWKAIFVHTVLLERGFVLWLDGGGRIVTPRALLNTLNWTKKNGFACCGSGDTVKDWTHPGELKYFQADFHYLREQENCDASRAGFTAAIYNDLIRPWYECSITRQCIAPDGSNRYNHRQDQAALTVLSVLTGHLCTGIDYKGITRHNDYNLYEFSGVDNTTCYKDPLLV